MTGWKRSFRLSARLTRWMNTLHYALHCWSRPYRRLYDACLALFHTRRHTYLPVRLCLEGLENRELLSANIVEQARAALLDDVAQFRKDVAISGVSLVNTVQPSQTNTPMPDSVANKWNKAWNVLTHDWQ